MERKRCQHVVVASKQVVVASGASVTAGLVAAGEGRRRVREFQNFTLLGTAAAVRGKLADGGNPRVVP